LRLVIGTFEQAVSTKTNARILIQLVFILIWFKTIVCLFKNQAKNLSSKIKTKRE
jgi:hypothetical protein